MQELVGGVASSKSLSEKFSELSGSYLGRAIFALLDEPRFQSSHREMAPKLKISLEELYTFLDLLVDLQLVKIEAGGKYVKVRDSLDFRTLSLDPMSELNSYKSVATEILIRQSPTAPCRYESSVLYTNKEALMDFLKKQDALIKEFDEKSKIATDKDILVGFQYSMADMTYTSRGTK